MSPRRGYSFIELLIVIAVLGALAALAVPRLAYMRRRALVAAAIGDLHAVRLAAHNYHIDRQQWPAESQVGVVPEGLAPYLPTSFRFDGPSYQIDWELWPLPNGLPGQPQPTELVGVSMVTDDVELGRMFLEALGTGVARFTSGDHYTLLIEG